MDKERAKFILSCYRPDGADALDPDFADALTFAAANRETGDWLAGERAWDAEFARLFALLPVPVSLRTEILAGSVTTASEPSYEKNDVVMAAAMASIAPPTDLRERVLTAMESSAKPIVWPFISWRNAGIPLAAAAGIALAFVFTHGPREEVPMVSSGSLGHSVAYAAKVPIPALEAGFVKTYHRPGFQLDSQQSDGMTLIADLKARGLPCPCCLPKGLADAKALGSREMVIDGKHGSLICFQLQDGGIVHLLVFKREDISCRIPSHARPKIIQNGTWATAKWATDERVFVLMSETGIGQIEALF
ncbi:MAG: hypothetical protein V4733_05615 [Verrucomicrobiota bacterium]